MISANLLSCFGPYVHSTMLYLINYNCNDNVLDHTILSAFLCSYCTTEAKEAEQVNKNINKQCWNVWYEAYLMTSDESSPSTSPTTSTPTTPSPSPRVTVSSYNFDNAPVPSGSGLKKSRKVYCYISKKVRKFCILCIMIGCVKGNH